MAEPFRQQFAAALSRRAAQHEGALQQALQARLAALQRGAAVPAQESPLPVAVPAGQAALSALRQQLEARRGRAPATPATVALGELRRTWSRLQAERRLAQSRAALPRNAGPLNSQQLMHRSLALMRELSPAYFERFIAYADTLLWLDQRPPPAVPDTPSRTRNRRSR